MIDIIKVELFRLKKSTVFWILLGIAAACPVLMILFNAFAIILVGGEINVVDALRTGGITNVLLQYATSVSNDVTLLALITTAIVLSKEFVDGTMRNVVLANKSRTSLYFAYLITSLIVALTYLTAFFAVTLIIVAPIFGFNGMSASKAVSACLCSYALGIVAVIFIETCVCMFVFGVRKQWAAILFPILIWLFVPAAFSTLLELLNAAMASNGQVISMNAKRWIPFVNIQSFDPANIDGALAAIHILYMAIFTAVFVVSGYFTFKKSDLK